MQAIEETIHIGDQEITFQTGKLARQASGSVLVKAGGTVVLVTAQASKEPREGSDFLPLTVDYQEKMSAAGRIPGGFFKREGKPRDEETLTSRMIDRSIRPLFPEGWACDTQIIATVFSADPLYPADTLALTGASAALGLSDIPFQGPIVALRICRVEDQLLVNPSFELREKADLNLFVTCSREAIVMVEGGGQEVHEAAVVDALLYAHRHAQILIDAQEHLQQKAGKVKRVSPSKVVNTALQKLVETIGLPFIIKAYEVREKQQRNVALDNAKKLFVEQLTAHYSKEAVEDLSLLLREAQGLFKELKATYVRQTILDKKIRIDGRGLSDIRSIWSETGLLPRTHGSALFTRGETQALVSVTLGTRQDEQKIDDLLGERYRNFMLHYNFPPYSVGEVKFLRGPGRREIGHGALAERALSGLVKQSDDFPYVIRVMSDILESNGSSSMATVCGGSMALMDAGVPMIAPCAGIAMGLIKEGEQVAILSDILGDEDHLGDMDFKVAGTQKGITAIQMDIKIDGVSREILEAALEQARLGRLHILGEMHRCIESTRASISDYAPRVTFFRINAERIGDVIGPQGKIIRDIVARTGCQINIGNDGLVMVSGTDNEAQARAIKIIQDLTWEAEVGKTYLGHVRKIEPFGAFVEIFPGNDGLIHISELASKRVKRVEDVLQEGDEVLVKVIGIEKGKIRLSRKEAILDEEARLQQAATISEE